MEQYTIYKDIAQRTQGDIYIGIVGPVRTGKSTFIKRFMDLLVLPNIENEHIRTLKVALSVRLMLTASLGMNLGSVVIMVRPAPLCGSSSLARSFLYGSSMQGMTNSSMIRLMSVDFPVRTGPTTPI